MKNTNKNKNMNNKAGGNLSKQVSDLLVPFGLILAKESLEKFLKQDNAKNSSSSRKTSGTKSKSGKKVSLSGGNSCGTISTNTRSVEPFTKASSTKYARVGGSGRSNKK
jgi:hypothetical protein